MGRTRILNPTRLLLVTMSILLLIIFSCPTSNSKEQEHVKKSLIRFMEKLSGGNNTAISKQWNMTSDPCQWLGATCDPETGLVWAIDLEGLNLSGTFDAASVCKAKALLGLSLKNNSLKGSIPAEIGNLCSNLLVLLLGQNRFTGSVPDSVGNMSGLVTLEISDNRLTGEVPDLSRMAYLRNFEAQNNRLTGSLLPGMMNFAGLKVFNVSNNDFRGEIPEGAGRFGADSFKGNPGLCGPPLGNDCSDGGSPAPAPPDDRPLVDPSTVDVSGGVTVQGNGIVMLLGLFFLVAFLM